MLDCTLISVYIVILSKKVYTANLHSIYNYLVNTDTLYIPDCAMSIIHLNSAPYVCV